MWRVILTTWTLGIVWKCECTVLDAPSCYKGPVRTWSGQSRHVTDRSGRIGLVRGKRTVNVVAYRLFHSPAKDLFYATVNHVHRQRATLQQHFANFSIFK